ncbi:hypothetical protein FRACYDRAFT_239709 [Fragilariopsis cylindrus CCMP1102]|uniref:TATA element modulatory factor 1 TATA binding domain-containing protein n=1 Tax=Fragilariopsis cylindrus CCMP1102 TaxID=635003 RepID=A0A1E7FA65_9STRA|nr:hypothetical protein FRACYDRAFT_239709 [Fragilariopsis cylindrus CCMP1102]|eukprot:OEU15029.1 hypothetical protein FRACYDRAFT_239709 [Fragilariopsis cylindrus CCMP1102]
MREKFKRLLSGRSLLRGNAEISGSAGGNDSSSLLNSREEDDWETWSFNKKNSKDRGRTDRRANNQRSQSERPTGRQRSRSEVSKRLKGLASDIGEATSTRKVKGSGRGSRSTGGVFRGDRSEVRSKIDSIALERSNSETRILKDGTSASTSKSTKKLRGGRRKSSLIDVDDNNDVIRGSGDSAPRRSRSASRSRRVSTTTDIVDTGAARVRASSKKATRRSRSISKARFAKSMSEIPYQEEEKKSLSGSGSTITTKDSSKKKKKKRSYKDKDKKKRNSTRSQSDDSSADISIPSRVETNNDSTSSYGSMSLPGSPKAKKKKVKDKTKKLKREKSKSKMEFPVLPVDDFGDGLEGLAEEFRRSKEGYIDEKPELDASASTFGSEVSNSKNNSSYTKVSSMFENAWTGMGKSKGTDDDKVQRNQEKLNPIANDNPHNPFADDVETKSPVAAENRNSRVIEDDLLRTAVDFQVTQTENNQQNEEILKLQQQLSTALQKQVTMSEEHIQEKDEFLQVSRELERVKVELMESLEERSEAMKELKERDRVIEDEKSRIDNLEQAIDRQLGREEELENDVRESEEEIEKLLDDIQNFEKKLENGESGGGGASFVELHSTKKLLSEKEQTVDSQILRIEKLEIELKDSMTVPQLQIEELDQEKKALQGRLKGERLEYTSKLVTKDETISSLRTELSSYSISDDAQDLQSAKQKLNEAREDATTVREDLIAARKIVERLHEDREDLIEKHNLLKENSVFMNQSMKELTEKSDNLRAKVLEWTEKTYDWKQKAESAERKLGAYNDDRATAASDVEDSVASEDLADEAPQGMFLQAAMVKRSSAPTSRSSSWGIFKNSGQNQELSAEEIRIRVLEEQNHVFEAKIADLSSELVKMQTAHKEELYNTKKKIARLEGENEALLLQNSTLEQPRDN